MRALLSIALALCVAACTGSNAAPEGGAPETDPTFEVVLTSEIEWGPLNPARGDKGPKAGALWGDRTGSGPSGFLVESVDGFSSPPHIHNITYRGVAISGLLHNDDPGAEAMWMPSGSYWMQPAGEAHITAAQGRSNLAYIEIQEGPYLVLPTEEANDNGERPINMEASNVVWLDASNISWIEQPAVPDSANGAKAAFLWGDPQDDQPSGTLVKLPAGFAGVLRSHGSTLRVVVIQGRPVHRMLGEADASEMEPGGYVGSKGAAEHQVSCPAEDECILYVRTEGPFDVLAVRPES